MQAAPADYLFGLVKEKHIYLFLYIDELLIPNGFKVNIGLIAVGNFNRVDCFFVNELKFDRGKLIFRLPHWKNN